MPPYVLVSGPESLLAERGVAQVLDDLKVSEPELETIRLYAAAYTAGELTLQGQQQGDAIERFPRQGLQALQIIGQVARGGMAGVLLLPVLDGGQLLIQRQVAAGDGGQRGRQDIPD